MPNWTKEQLDAINKEGTNIIVSAGAGSGKTAVLSERVIRKLKENVSISNLLVITFTNAAAFEMKDRIRKKISENNDIIKELDNIDSAYITTFDSYALSIVKKYNYLINVSKNISIIEKNIMDIEKNKILDSLFEELYLEKNTKFLKLIDDFCTKDDKEIKNYIIDINDKLDLIYKKEDYLKKYITNYYNDEFINNQISDYEKLLFSKIGLISSNLLELEEYVEVEYYDKIKECLEKLLISSNYNSIKSNIVSLPQLPKNSLEQAKKIKENISGILKEISNMCSYDSIDEIKKSIYETKEYAEVIVDILIKFNKCINNYKDNNNLYEFIDIAKMAIKIVEENKEVREEIKNSFNEILIDEYQDTNDLQDLFISYIENNNVYMVGDIKQSIYRFRNANPYLFKDKYDKYSNLDNGIKIDLNKNFRSREEVLSNINLIFDSIMDDKLGGADYKKTHRMVFGNNKYNLEGKTNESNDIEIYNYLYDKNSGYKKEEIEIFIIANDIKNKIDNNYQIFDSNLNKIRNIEYKDIAILMDRSTNFSLYKKIFEYLNIPLAIYKDETLTNSVDISIIKNIINLIISNEINEGFKYSFISILRSYLFNLDDNTIFKYFLNNNYLDSELMKIILSINYKELNIKQLLEQIIDKFNFYEKMINVGDIEGHFVVLEHLLNISDELSKMGYTIFEFYDYLEQIIDNNYDINYESFKNPEAVKIMTIHKSKGLEYPICYYSGIYSKFNTSELKEKFIYDNKLGIILPFIDNGIRNTIYKDLLKDKYLKEEISEKIRLFYVALTRTKEKMIIVTPELEEVDIQNMVPLEQRMKYTSFYDILNSIENEIRKYKKVINIDEISLTHDYNFIKKDNYEKYIDSSNQVIVVNELNLDNSEVKENRFSKVNNNLINNEDYKNISFGKKIHSIFENIDFINPDYKSLSNYEKELVMKFINTGILANVKQIYKEYEFIYMNDGRQFHGIIDLLLELEHEYKIIDYKLKNIDDEAYINQLNGYKNYIEKLTGKEVKIYLYSIIGGVLKQLD